NPLAGQTTRESYLCEEDHLPELHLRGKQPAKAAFARKIICRNSTCGANHPRKLPLRGRSSAGTPLAGQTIDLST
ncbi:MAG: hypothetical protein ACOYOS_23105, partial [Syntrophales bacterium]